jgi:tetratricopeptide (TPR) repeat protein
LDVSFPQFVFSDPLVHYSKGVFQLHVIDFLSWIYFEFSNLDKRESFARQQLALARRVSDQQLIAYTLTQIGWVAEKRGNYQVAEGHFRNAIPHFVRLGDRPQQVEFTFLLGELMFLKGDFNCAKALMREALNFIQHANIGGFHRNEQLLIRFVLAVSTQYEQAEKYFSEEDQ